MTSLTSILADCPDALRVYCTNSNNTCNLTQLEQKATIKGLTRIINETDLSDTKTLNVANKIFGLLSSQTLDEMDKSVYDQLKDTFQRLCKKRKLTADDHVDEPLSKKQAVRIYPPNAYNVLDQAGMSISSFFLELFPIGASQQTSSRVESIVECYSSSGTTEKSIKVALSNISLHPDIKKIYVFEPSIHHAPVFFDFETPFDRSIFRNIFELSGQDDKRRLDLKDGGKAVLIILLTHQALERLSPFRDNSWVELLKTFQPTFTAFSRGNNMVCSVNPYELSYYVRGQNSLPSNLVKMLTEG